MFDSLILIFLSSIVLLTGPNGGGKSSILRSICAGALLATCGLMVPARKATIPHLDAIILRMMSTDSPADSKSAFQMVCFGSKEGLLLVDLVFCCSFDLTFICSHM